VNPVPEIDENILKQNLITQVTSPVRWTDTIKFFIEQGVEIFIEFGPKVLTPMLAKMLDKPLVYDMERDLDTVHKLPPHQIYVFNVEKTIDTRNVWWALEQMWDD
jgi:malonyl CoA-acyl carrier protein transacylase